MVEHRVEAEADAVERHDFADRIEHFAEEAGAVFVAAAVFVVAPVRLVREELVEQVAVRRVDFDAVETGGHGVGGGTAEIGDDGLDLVAGQRVRRDRFRLAGRRKHLPVRVDRGRRHRRLAVVELGQRQAAAMPELADDQPALFMHGIGHQPASRRPARPTRCPA
jgi:hypothetical protein